MALMWGDYKEAYCQAPRILQAMSHFNLGLKWSLVITPNFELHNGVWKHQLLRVFWALSQCMEAFKHYRPVISVDATFLTGKYKGALLITLGIDGEDSLVPLAFALAEFENNDSWSWLLHLVMRDVVGPGRQICIISDWHQGILNAVNECWYCLQS